MSDDNDIQSRLHFDMDEAFWHRAILASFHSGSAAVGGVLIGLSAVLLMLFSASPGVSGIFGGLMDANRRIAADLRLPASWVVPLCACGSDLIGWFTVAIRAAGNNALFRPLRWQ